ncbi:AAA family ATPase [Carnobacterium gallinarum]|uniref:ATP-binding protein n=1 Tax=Carnobacterium gallinarum TaxID=2749 RepID=UPI00054EBDB9|nr:AAA family ATPase [Carnobacterium gallinarum]
MKIKTIEIYGYGKWVNQTFDLAEGMQIFYGKNEAGKSTLMSFIHSILFGFPSKQGSDLQYEPRKGSQYGGRLRLVDTIYGEVLVERIKGKGNGKVLVTLADGQIGEEDLLKRIVFGLDKATYQALFSFNLDGLQKIQQMSGGKLSRYFLSVGTLGNEHLLKIADKFQQQAAKLYKPTGRVPEINQKLASLKQKEQQLKTAKAKNTEYNQLMSQKLVLTGSLHENQEKREALEINLVQLRRLSNNWSHFNEIQEIQNQIQKEKLTDLPEDGLYQLKQVNDELQRLTKEIIQAQEQIAYLSQKAGQSEDFSFYLEHKLAIKEVVLEANQTQAVLQSKEILQAQYLQAHYYLEQLLTKMGLPVYGDLPAPLAMSEQEQIHSQLEAEKALKERKKVLAYEKQRIDFQLESCNQQIDKLENQLWENKTFHDFNQGSTIEDSSNLQRSKIIKSISKMPAYVGLGLASVSIILGLILNSGIGWGIVALGIFLLAGSSYFILPKHNKEIKPHGTPSEATYSYEEYIQQVEIRKQWREKLAEADEATETLNQMMLQIEELESLDLQLNQKQQKLKTNLGLPVDFSLESLITTDPFLEIRQQIQLVDQQEAELAEQERQLTKWMDKAEFCKSIVNYSSDRLAEFIVVLQQFYQKQQEIEKSQQTISQQVTEINQQLAAVKEQQATLKAEKLQLFQLVEVTDEEAYHKKYILNQQLQQKKARLDLLEDQMAEDLVQFARYRDEQALLESIIEEEEYLKELKEQFDQRLNQKVECEVALKNLEEGGQYSVLLQELANLKSELQELVDRWSSLQIAAELIELTLTLARKDRLPATMEDTSIYFKRLTENKYLRVLFRNEQIEVQHQDGTFFEAQELSKGTAEQLYVALRLAFVKNAEDLLEMPLLIDDGFVNFDKERKGLVLHLLNELSQTNQILYFTYEAEIYNEFPQSQVKVLQ